MMIVNCKRSKRSSAYRLESFSLAGLDARSWFGMTFAKESPAWCAMAAVRFRRLAAGAPGAAKRQVLPHSRPSIRVNRKVSVG
jgi:hypothetical protein